MKAKYYTVKVVAGEVVRVKKMKVHLPPRNAFGQFVASGRRCHGYCRWFGLCPFTTKGL